jgi:hypothetical protein
VLSRSRAATDRQVDEELKRKQQEEVHVYILHRLWQFYIGRPPTFQSECRFKLGTPQTEVTRSGTDLCVLD